ncbi:MAG: hypothetical protein JXR97_11990 [Planctomycetes bacterium]|nr:hypothetical protein [Planctomycetota bacterium]
MRNDVASQRYMRSAAKLFPAVVQKSNEQGKKQWSDSLMMQTAEVISEIIAYYNHLKYEHITPSDNFDAAEALITEIEEIIGEDDSDDKGQKAS